MLAYRLIKILVPIGVAIDMVHSFYYVGCMIKENMERIEEKKKRELAVTVGTVLCKVGESCKSADFWPAGVSSDLESVVLPSLVLPPPSYEDRSLEFTVLHKIASLLHPLKIPAQLELPQIPHKEENRAKAVSSADNAQDEYDKAGLQASTFVQEFDGVEMEICANESDGGNLVESNSSEDFVTRERSAEGRAGGMSQELEDHCSSFEELAEGSANDSMSMPAHED